jgi:hypothetical protein
MRILIYFSLLVLASVSVPDSNAQANCPERRTITRYCVTLMCSGRRPVQYCGGPNDSSLNCVEGLYEVPCCDITIASAGSNAACNGPIQTRLTGKSDAVIRVFEPACAGLRPHLLELARR